MCPAHTALPAAPPLPQALPSRRTHCPRPAPAPGQPQAAERHAELQVQEAVARGPLRDVRPE